jgi:hypothetical protein
VAGVFALHLCDLLLELSDFLLFF